MGIGYTYSSVYQNYYMIGYNSCVAALDNGRVFFTSVTAPTTTYTQQSNTYGGPVRATYSAGYPYYSKRIFVFDANLGGDIEAVDAAGWTGASYQHVQGLVVSDDGTTVSAVDSTYTSYHYMDQERFTVWSGIELNPNTGAMTGSVTQYIFETTGCMSDCAAFGPKLQDVYYGGRRRQHRHDPQAGARSAAAPPGMSLGFGTARYAALHVGRRDDGHTTPVTRKSSDGDRAEGHGVPIAIGTRQPGDPRPRVSWSSPGVPRNAWSALCPGPRPGRTGAGACVWIRRSQLTDGCGQFAPIRPR